MKPAVEWDEQHILGLPSGEFDWLEFKSSKSLDLTIADVKESDVRNELSKQLSAFSNSGGGTLVYGITDPVVGKPHAVDTGGVSLQCKGKSTKEWLEDIIPNLVELPLNRFNVHAVVSGQAESKIANGKGLFVIEIPDSEQAPHQANDKKYYARVGGKSRPIGHRLVSDIFGRTKYPKFEMLFGLIRDEESPDLMVLHSICRNAGRVFANYVNGEILIPMGILPRELTDQNDIVSREGARYLRICFNNVHKDVVGMADNPIYPHAFTISRYDPVLPTQGFPVSTNVKMTVLQRHDFAAKEIHWEVFADNAPVQSGKMAVGSLKLFDPHDH